ncbi:CsgG/HfaB family protein [Saccharospirillum sp. HFRX-1]|uniref:CsgG/HfaB family protein n=1 Tax=unclassified Saccharospirillum TaxID=2633430 RepID=UPI003710FFAE
MKKLLLLTLPLVLAACASQSPNLTDVEAPVSAAQQRAAQQAAAAPTRLALKRKIAVGRLSNETTYGRSLLGTNAGNNIDQKITDMFVQSLINSNNYLVFERPDVALLERESELSGQSVNIVGVDTLVIGSLTEFGRSTTGESGFLSSSKRQEATATVDLRLVDTRTGQVTESVTGTGSSSTETASTMGFGSVASYDGSLNDQAIGAAVNAAVEKLTLLMLEKPWSADVLAVEDGLVYISGGASQGIRPGMVFDVMTRGRQVTSQTTGGIITLPGNKIGELRIDGTFGDSELEEGAYGGLISGSIAGQDLNQLEVREAN